MSGVATANTVTGSNGLLRKSNLQATSVFLLVVVCSLLALAKDTRFVYMLVYVWFGLAYGMLLQYGRFCMASAIRDLFAVGVPRMAVGIMIAVVLFSLVSAAAYAVAQLPLMLLRARESSVSYVSLSLFQFLAMLGLNVWLVGGLHLGVKGVLLGSIGASGATFLASLPFLARHASLRFSPRLTRALLMFGLPMVPVAVSGAVAVTEQALADCSRVGGET